MNISFIMFYSLIQINEINTVRKCTNNMYSYVHIYFQIIDKFLCLPLSNLFPSPSFLFTLSLFLFHSLSFIFTLYPFLSLSLSLYQFCSHNPSPSLYLFPSLYPFPSLSLTFPQLSLSLHRSLSHSISISFKFSLSHKKNLLKLSLFLSLFT